MSTATSAPNPKFAHVVLQGRLRTSESGHERLCPIPPPPAAGITPSRNPPDLAIRVPATLKALAAFDVGIDRHHRAPSTGGLRRVPRAARGRLDGAADAALSESAARPHRGADLWPRMAARLR